MIKTGKFVGTRNFLFTALFIFSFAVPALAEVKVELTSDQAEISSDEPFTLTFSVISEDSLDLDVQIVRDQLSAIKSVEVLNQWTQSATSSHLVKDEGGMTFKTQRRLEFHFMVQPSAAGDITVPNVKVDIAGKSYTAEGFRVRVLDAKSGSIARKKKPLPNQNPLFPTLLDDEELDEAEALFMQQLQRRGQNAPTAKLRNLPDKPNDAFFVLADVDKTTVYEGEQIQVDWYLYARGNILSLDRLKFPDLKGFWKEIIEEVPALTFSPEEVNGVRYRKALLASHALFPIKPGTVAVDEFKIKASVQLPLGPFGGFGQPYTYTRSSDRVPITVKPLPTEGKPKDFSGAVGEYNIQVLVPAEKSPAWQPLPIRIRFEGTGNAKLIELPELKWPESVDIYSQKSESKFFRNGASYKEFEVIVIPKQEGPLEIPSFTFSIFDPKKEKYVTLKTGSAVIEITPGAAPAGGLANLPGAAADKTSPDLLKAAQTPEVSLSLSKDTGLSNILRILFIVCAFLALATFYFYLWKKHVGFARKIRTVKAYFEEQFKKAGHFRKSSPSTQQWRELGAQMTNVIYQSLGELSGLSGSPEQMNRMLESLPASLKKDLGEQFKKSLGYFETLAFAPENLLQSLDPAKTAESEFKACQKLIMDSIKNADIESRERVSG